MQVWATWRQSALTTPAERSLSSPARGLEGIGGKELSRLAQLVYLAEQLARVGLGKAVLAHEESRRVFFRRAGAERGYGVVRRLVDEVHRAGADVEDYIVSAELILMYHGETPIS